MYADLHSIDGLVRDSDEYAITVTGIEDVTKCPTPPLTTGR